jgi:glycosyltransferase involved in cell wall biosynthesis
MSQHPFISVCIPAYEKAAALQRLLESAVNQRFRDFEVVITDDSHTDAVEKTAAAFAGKLPIRYYRNSPACGMGNNWNNCIQKATAPWIKMMHDDDWFASETALEKFAAQAKSATSDFIFSACYQVYADQDSASIDSFAHKDKKLAEGLPLSLLFLNTVGHPSVTMFKKDERIYFDPQFRWVIDIDFYIHYLQQHGQAFSFVDEPLVNITKDDNQVSAGCYKNPLVEIPEYLTLLTKFPADLHLTNRFAFYSVWELVRKFTVTDVSQFKNFGYQGKLPERIKDIIRYQQKIPRIILKQPPLNRWLMDRCFRKLNHQAL